MLDSVERLANELVKLPEVKEGETLTAPSKVKANDVLESIGREMSKKKAQEKTSVSSVSSGKSEGIKFEDSTLMKRREGGENKSYRPSLVVPEEPKKESPIEDKAGDALIVIPVSS